MRTSFRPTPPPRAAHAREHPLPTGMTGRARRPRSAATTWDDVAAHVEAAIRFGAPGTVGAELELLVADRTTPSARPPLARVAAAVPEPLPGGSLVTVEPGGQLELSSQPFAGPAAAVAALAADLAATVAALSADDLVLTGLGADPLRPPVRLVRTPRYDVMEAHFASGGPVAGAAGRAMMCSSAAVQVSLDAGTWGGGRQSAASRWQRAHAVGPALAAAFACSPLLRGEPTGWRSTRQRFWRDLDPSRTAPPDPRLGPVEATTELALAAQVLTVRDADGTCRPAPCGLSFGAWWQSGEPTDGDLAYHLTTLFPPVRLRGWFELRFLDMLPDPLWQVPVAVAAALLDDDLAADAAREACAPVEGRWTDAARLATSDPALARAAAGCLEAAVSALPRLGAASLVPAVEGFAERFTARGRCPADELLDARAAGVPPSELLLGRVGVAA